MHIKNENSEHKKDAKKSYGIIIALSLVITFYLVLFFVNRTVFFESINKFWELLTLLFPLLFLVFVVMVITIFFLKPDKIKKHLGKESGIKGMILISIAGILSVGPAYVWYPLISELKEKGMRKKLVTIFIYNRAIKLHLLPLMIFYFGLKFSLVISFLIFAFSFVLGEFVEKFTIDNEL